MLNCTSFGLGICELAMDREIVKLVAGVAGWLMFNPLGLDGEGWGPVRA